MVRAALREAIARPPAEGPSQPLGAGWGAEVGRPRTGVSEQNPSARPSLRWLQLCCVLTVTLEKPKRRDHPARDAASRIPDSQKPRSEMFTVYIATF